MTTPSEFMVKQPHWVKLTDDTYAEPLHDGVWVRKFECGNDYQCNTVQEVFVPWSAMGKLSLLQMQHERSPGSTDEPLTLSDM